MDLTRLVGDILDANDPPGGISIVYAAPDEHVPIDNSPASSGSSLAGITSLRLIVRLGPLPDVTTPVAVSEVGEPASRDGPTVEPTPAPLEPAEEQRTEPPLYAYQRGRPWSAGEFVEHQQRSSARNGQTDYDTFYGREERHE